MQFSTRLALVDAQENVLKMWNNLGTNFTWQTNGVRAQQVGGTDPTDPNDPNLPPIISGGVFGVQVDSAGSPTAIDDNAVTAPGVPVTIDVLANDTSDPAVTLHPSVVEIGSQPAHGSVGVDPNTGEITYTPASGFLGQDTFTYTVSDTVGQITNAAKVTINVTASANHPPSLAVIPDQMTTAGQGVTFTASALDPDASNSLTYSLDSGAPAGASINPTTGAFSWTPTPAQGGKTYTIAVRVRDNGTPNLSAVQDGNISVAAVTPVASNDTVMTTQGTPVFISELDNDSSVDGTIDPTSVAMELFQNNFSRMHSLAIIPLWQMRQ